MTRGLKNLFKDRKERGLAKKLINATPKELMRPYFDNEDREIARKVLGDNSKKSNIEKCGGMLIALSRAEYIHYRGLSDMNTKALYSRKV